MMYAIVALGIKQAHVLAVTDTAMVDKCNKLCGNVRGCGAAHACIVTLVCCIQLVALSRTTLLPGGIEHAQHWSE
jgi:hypothetical protein